MSDHRTEITTSVETLAELLAKAQLVGWELAHGFHTAESARRYLRDLVAELVRVELP